MGDDATRDELRDLIKDLRDVVSGLRAVIEAQAAGMAKQAERIEELEARLRRDSSSSSKPPSSDGPWSKKRRGRRPPSDKKQGGQPGHPGKARERLPESDVDEIVDHEPSECTACGHDVLDALERAPRWRQITELLEVLSSVTEHRLHWRRCRACGEEVVAEPPAELPNGSFGPRLRAFACTLVAGYRLSRREVARLLGEACGVSLSPGTVSNFEREMADALVGAHAEAVAALRASPVANIDETPWKERGLLRWVWTGVGEGVIAHRIDDRRNHEALERLIGEDFDGIVVSDRMGAYDSLPTKRRQLCWAHLERDFRAFAQGPASCRPFGARGLEIAQGLMRARRHLKEHGDRARFDEELQPHLGGLIDLLVDGAASNVRYVSGFSAHLLARSEALWVFADQVDVPPTNNAAERAVRKAVLWRKGSFGSQSERGLRFAERMLTVIATKRRRSEGVLDYLVEVARAAIAGTAPPRLIPQPARG